VSLVTEHLRSNILANSPEIHCSPPQNALSPLVPLHTGHSPVTPFVPTHTRKHGSTPVRYDQSFHFSSNSVFLVSHNPTFYSGTATALGRITPRTASTRCPSPQLPLNGHPGRRLAPFACRSGRVVAILLHISIVGTRRTSGRFVGPCLMQPYAPRPLRPTVSRK
jgi:hypothetical protein